MTRNENLWALGGLLASVAVGCSIKQETEAATSKPSKSSYQVTAKVEGKGSERELELSLRAEGGYKVNSDYPLKFVPEKAQTEVLFKSTEYALTPFSKEACADKKNEVCEVRAKVPFEVTQEAKKVDGVLKMSVCSVDKCLIEKVPVSAEFQPTSF